MANGEQARREAFAPGAASVIWNPVSGRPRRRRRAARLAARLEELGYAVSRTEGPGHATDLATSGRTGALIVLGGDGTLREALAAADPGRPFAFHPSGTVNLFARSLGIPTDPDAWLALLERGTTRPVFLARCNGAPFLSVASTGFDAAVCARVSPRLKRWMQEGAYGWRALLDLPRFLPSHCEIVIDDGTEPWISAPLSGVLIGKGPFYGGRHRLLPGADPGSASLEVVALAGTRRRDIVRFGGAMLRGTLPPPPLTARCTARSVRIAARPKDAVQLDGEPHGTTPALFEVEQTARRALAPPHEERTAGRAHAARRE